MTHYVINDVTNDVTKILPWMNLLTILFIVGGLDVYFTTFLSISMYGLSCSFKYPAQLL